ncbi:ABSCISIC ACID-INSENSITIVE 5-like protein 2 [Cucurbita moschata]|uniref:ABSCISIC ACID-INSENSITIVE 5-like protein 2 n=2 Tax=Cucurbita TaxID=3660 RepID=A0A6J1FHN1_CUCMO|nr:ABSCISIC ACID-INSENSITIVE 5-like protein 2 [Cucurbita moschata]XP_022939733.1 ABSCISIC ACID-INSENSITIVE 5-like protein 2 [Cucurbita moschata]XP_022939735.1 ABSCISIC ACID-INSENSITIVE 5-like protein 2 [Cucurbita moschata]
MGIQTMGSQAGGDPNGKQSQFQPLVRQSSLYNLTLDEVQNQLGDLGKPLVSMNLDELLKNVWTAEANQTVGKENEDNTVLDNQTSLQRQASLSLNGALSKKTVDEVWRDIQQSKNSEEKKSREQQPTLGEMTLEDFLVKAGVVAETSSNKKGAGSVVEIDANITPQFQQTQWMQYPQPPYQSQQAAMMGVYMSGQPIPQPLHVGAGAVMDVPYVDNQMALQTPLMGTLSDTPTSGRKRGAPEDMIEKTVERRQKRMIKNRESAARSRARKQAYTNELENKVSRLEEENERLRKRKELEKMLPLAPSPEPKYQLRRTSSAPF